MSPAQQRALESLWPAFGIPFAPSPLDFDGVFGRRAPRVLDIGFGMGETTAAIARCAAGRGFPRASKCTRRAWAALLKRIAEGGLANVRVIRHDAVEVVAAMIPPAIARRRPRLLSRPVAQEAPSQAAAPDAAVRA